MDNLTLEDLSARASSLRKDVRNYFGGVAWKPITKQFGIYTMNVPESEAFMSYAEHHLVELEKLLGAAAEQPNKHSIPAEAEAE